MPWKHFKPTKAFLVNLYLKTEKCIIMLETSRMEKTSVHITNMLIKQLCNHKVYDFAIAFQVQKLFKTFSKLTPELYSLYIPVLGTSQIKYTFYSFSFYHYLSLLIPYVSLIFSSSCLFFSLSSFWKALVDW